ncbi:subtilisin-like serine protease [Fragilariopsis cylindrus CCMP1102]|uniref:subtilisin n=1 Tax=Fragilariopsis cylindrus CCMP1102 TaxID=635003 RepID=A0A1E7F8A8_9STRA|nr:subtilisin-like serine protease [Fragilariopsis cylindrus CCMP1102]|eukprot:OEU14397.1 subtilisin-like serine protease [Fragilariopsis cylindrus CCMP1102]
MVQGTELWSLDQNNRSIEVCVVDTGYNAGHEDLPTVLAKQVGGTNTGAGVWFNDGHGHGTHCSGIIGAVGNNDIGVVGIREKPTLNVFHAGKGLADDGSGYSSNIMSAVQGCVDDGAEVISLSLGGYKNSSIERAFYDDIYNQGILVVAAAGNSGNSGPLFPGSYPSVISVSAVDQNGIRPDFSQCNNQVEIVAPGVDIMSTFPPNTYATLSGTSMAGPHVAGIAAQLMSFFPECTNYQIRTAMVRSADSNIGEYPGYCNNGYGSGLVQGKAAYDLYHQKDVLVLVVRM